MTAVTVTASLLFASTARADDQVPNTLVKRMYERRARKQRVQAGVGGGVGGTLLLGGLIGQVLVLHADAHTQALALPWLVDAGLLGFCATLASAGSHGQLDVENGDRLDPNGTTSRAELIARDRQLTRGARRVLAAGLATGLSVMALGGGTILLGEYGTAPGGDKTAWLTSGAAIASLGVVVAGLGLGAWAGMRRQSARLDAGIIDDLDDSPTVRLTVAPIGWRNGAGLGLSGSF